MQLKKIYIYRGKIVSYPVIMEIIKEDRTDFENI